MAAPLEQFYSDRTSGPISRSHEALPEATKSGLQALLQRRVQGNWLAEQFPSFCSDGNGIAETNVHDLGAELGALFVGVGWPLWQESPSEEVVFDVIEYVGRRLSKPTNGSWHSYMRHYELEFDRARGRSEFVNDVNLLLSRGGTVFELSTGMVVQRVGVPETRAALSALKPATGDLVLDGLIESGRELYQSREASQRATAIEKLWDGFERLKTVELPDDKKKSTIALLSHIVDAELREFVDTEMRELTRLGNNFQIRHHETNKPPVPASAQDYVVGRMATLLTFLLDQSGRLSN